MDHLRGTSLDLGELLHGTFRGLRRTWAEQLAPWDLTPHQWRALMTLLRRYHEPQHPAGDVGTAPGGGPMRLKDLAERLHIAARSATEVVDQLEAKGLVSRERDPTDRRAILIVPTPAGQRLYADVSADRRDKSNEYFGQLSVQDRADLARILGKLHGR